MSSNLNSLVFCFDVTCLWFWRLNGFRLDFLRLPQRIQWDSQLQLLQLQLQSKAFQAVDNLETIYEISDTSKASLTVMDQPNTVADHSLMDEANPVILELVYTLDLAHASIKPIHLNHLQNIHDHLT